MASQKPNGCERRQGRTWSFANCIFDENAWALRVDGQRVALEAKPLELLHELLLNAGTVVTKDELLDRIWPDVIVVEASLPTAVRKLRLVLGDDRRERAVIETVAGVGYRLAVPVEVERRSLRPEIVGRAADAERRAGGETKVSYPSRARGFRRLTSIAAGLALLAMAVSFGLGQSQDVAANTAPPRFDTRLAANALRRLDVGKIEEMIAAGWNPNATFDAEGNNAINYLLNMCEWDRGHDRRRMLLMARTLFEAGAQYDRPNLWGDTAYSIAKAPRYCGPEHPVTEMIRTMCYTGPGASGDRCLATYELERQRRRS